jgi:Asp-tRNA(Asn)/Glu-tRNA(Gln) amidotransferase A subunit family amidase
MPHPVNRRTFLAAVSAAAAASAAARTVAQTPRLETLTEWMNASRDARARALPPAVDYIRATDSSIHAWVQVLPQRPTGDGPLAEIPFGAKDIMETRGLSTEYGSPIYKGRIGTADAAIVRDLRARGAVLMGKTHTTAFAYREPAPTVNPRNHDHTPGGSSSGSAAAVAAGMIPFALGTQTMGSVLRPASYCGVTGFKGTYGLVSLEGVLPFAKSLDTLGYFTHTPADMLALWQAMGHPGGQAEEIDIGAPDPVPQVEAPMVAAFQSAVAALRRGGVAIRSVNIAAMLADLHDAANTVEFYEGARFHEERYREYGARLAHMGELVREGLTFSVEKYDEARRRIAEARSRVAEMFKATPVILVPAATGPAPRGLALTGDSRMNSPWTALGTPAITIPMPVGEALPLGLQLTAAHDQDARVIRAAVRVHQILNTGGRNG